MVGMKAVVIRQFGGPEVFETAEVPRPATKPGHVLIRVAASSVNPVDYKIRSGVTPFAPDLPAVLHGDVAGVIEEVGDGVSGFKPGDEVYACAGGVRGTGGALAEYMLADADSVALKPKTLSMAEAAALPLVAITAWEALIDRAKVGPGQTVLVHAAAGGVGHIGVQLAKWAGAKVYATASNDEKLAIAKRLGADAAINYRERTVRDYVDEYTGGKGFDVVFDTVGGDNFANSFEAAKLNGTVAAITGLQKTGPIFLKGLTLHAVLMLIPLLHGVGRKRHGEILANVAKLVDEGKLRPLIDARTFGFSEAGEAHRRLESGEATGKVVLVNDL